MRKVVVVSVFLGALALAIQPSRSAPSPIEAPKEESNPPEPITGEPVMPAPGAESTLKSPFEPYSIGPPEAAWTYNDLTPAEREQVDRNRDTSRWEGVHDAYAHAVIKQAAAAAASAAAIKLGVENLEDGVVP